MDAFAFIGELAQKAISLVPWPFIVPKGYVAVEYRLGRWPRVLDPGFYFRWELFATYDEDISLKRGCITREQKFKHNDSTFAYRWRLVYKVADPLKSSLETDDIEDMISEFTEIAFTDAFATLEPDDVAERTSAEEIQELIARDLETIGVEVIKFRVTSFATVSCHSVWELSNANELLEYLQ